jgi:translation initiation factor IF-2
VIEKPAAAPKPEDARKEKEKKWKKTRPHEKKVQKAVLKQTIIQEVLAEPEADAKKAEGAAPAPEVVVRQFQPGRAAKRRGGRPVREKKAPSTVPPKASKRNLKIEEVVTVGDLAHRMGVKAAEVIKKLIEMGMPTTVNQLLDADSAALLAQEYGFVVENVAPEVESLIDQEEDRAEDLRPRPPVVTIMGHVDHGKTTLLDAIRESNITGSEAGGITQHIGAYEVEHNGRRVVFLDTPGHEAFTSMRARGASVTDIVILVVGADDGVMPQTVESIDHAKAAGVPIVVAVNKIDKPEADPTRVRQQMVELGIVPSEWGGQNEFVDVSAKARTNLDNMLETILLVADLEELRGDPVGRARGVVLEAHLDKGRGPVASVLVQRGTLDVGDTLVSGTSWAKIRAMLDENGQQVKQAGPSKPVQILGWSATPNAGDDIREVADEREARHMVQEREAKVRAAEMVTTRPPTLQELMAQAQRDEVPELNLIVKADVQGSIGALVDALAKLPQDEVRVNVIRSAAGAITESDINLALTSRAIVVGFNVRPDVQARDLAEKEGVDVRLYRVIYDAIDDIRNALGGMLKPEQRETQLGRAEVRALFRVPKVGLVAGSYVVQGTITRNARARVIRDGVVAYDGRIGSLRRFKDDVREVSEGFECGIGIENFNDVKEGDIIEAYEVREVAREL